MEKVFKSIHYYDNGIDVQHVEDKHVIVKNGACWDDNDSVIITFKRPVDEIEDIEQARAASNFIKDEIMHTVVGISNEAAYALLLGLQDYFIRVKPELLK